MICIKKTESRKDMYVCMCVMRRLFYIISSSFNIGHQNKEVNVLFVSYANEVKATMINVDKTVRICPIINKGGADERLSAPTE